MPYAFATLFFILGLVTGIPALLQLRRMETIKRSSASTSGVVRTVGRSNIGWNFLGEVGRSARPSVAFRVGSPPEKSSLLLHFGELACIWESPYNVSPFANISTN